WMLATQLGVLLVVWVMGMTSPARHLPVSLRELSALAYLLAVLTSPIALLVFALSLLSATQDIALDAYRRELLPEIEFGLGNAIHVNAYKLAGLVPGSLSLILADRLPWATA